MCIQCLGHFSPLPLIPSSFFTCLFLSCQWQRQRTEGVTQVIRMPALQVWSPEFKPHFHQIKKRHLSNDRGKIILFSLSLSLSLPPHIVRWEYFLLVRTFNIYFLSKFQLYIINFVRIFLLDSYTSSSLIPILSICWCQIHGSETKICFSCLLKNL
jgi:hypothetical protein